MKRNPSVLCSGVFQLKILENASCSQGIGTKVQLWWCRLLCSFLKLITDFVGVKVLSFVTYRHCEGNVGIAVNVWRKMMNSLALLGFNQVFCSTFSPPVLHVEATPNLGSECVWSECWRVVGSSRQVWVWCVSFSTGDIPSFPKKRSASSWSYHFQLKLSSV